MWIILTTLDYAQEYAFSLLFRTQHVHVISISSFLYYFHALKQT